MWWRRCPGRASQSRARKIPARAAAIESRGRCPAAVLSLCAPRALALYGNATILQVYTCGMPSSLRKHLNGDRVLAFFVVLSGWSGLLSLFAVVLVGFEEPDYTLLLGSFILLCAVPDCGARTFVADKTAHEHSETAVAARADWQEYGAGLFCIPGAFDPRSIHQQTGTPILVSRL